MLDENYIRSVKLNDKYIHEIENSYLKDVASVKFLLEGNTIQFDKRITFIIGENGIGKSTLLEAIAVA
ncbi:MAG: AAA family ATPase, partial [Eubacterium sp.]|nr:AAA family ATPase [Eubacterium sp.]